MTLIFRDMVEADDGLPELGRSGVRLGVRVKGESRFFDVAPDDDGFIEAGRGMSSAPDDPMNLPERHRPAELGGTGDHPVWAFDTSAPSGQFGL